MTNKLILLIIGIVGFSVSTGYCDDIGIAGRNPFESWLPKVEEKIVKTPEEDKLASEAQQAAKKVEITQPPELKINGIVWGTKQPQAIINGRVVAIGDIIENSKVVDIRRDGVDIIFSEKLFTIPVAQTLTQSI